MTLCTAPDGDQCDRFSVGASIRRTRGTHRLGAEVFNLFDTTNYDVASVDNAMYLSFKQDPNPNFGAYTATLPPREIQLGVRYGF